MSNRTSYSATGVSGQVASLNDSVALNISPYRFVAVLVEGTFVATLTAQVTIDGQNWFAVNLTPLNGGTGTSTPVAGTLYTLQNQGYAALQIVGSAYTSGTANVAVNGSGW